jgi:hypothetical protein
MPISLCCPSIFVVLHFVSEFFDYVMGEFVVMCDAAYGVPFFVFVVTVHRQFLFHWVIRGVANSDICCCGFSVDVDIVFCLVMSMSRKFICPFSSYVGVNFRSLCMWSRYVCILLAVVLLVS